MSKEMKNEVVRVKEKSKKITKQDIIKAAEILAAGVLSGIFGYKVGKFTKNVEVLTVANKVLGEYK